MSLCIVWMRDFCRYFKLSLSANNPRASSSGVKSSLSLKFLSLLPTLTKDGLQGIDSTFNSSHHSYVHFPECSLPPHLKKSFLEFTINPPASTHLCLSLSSPLPCTQCSITSSSSPTYVMTFPSIPWGNRQRGHGHVQLIRFPVILNTLPSVLSSAALTALGVHRKPWQMPQPTLATLLPEMVRTTPTQGHHFLWPFYGSCSTSAFLLPDLSYMSHVPWTLGVCLSLFYTLLFGSSSTLSSSVTALWRRLST